MQKASFQFHETGIWVINHRSCARKEHLVVSVGLNATVKADPDFTNYGNEHRHGMIESIRKKSLIRSLEVTNSQLL
jgi:hypothetical protein